MIELQSNEKVATPPPFTGLSPLSSKKNCTPPQVMQFLEGPIHPFNKGGGEGEGGGGSNYVNQ